MLRKGSVVGGSVSPAHKQYFQDSSFILCAPGMGHGQRSRLEAIIREAGGRMVDVLNHTTQYILTTDSWDVTQGWLKKNVKCEVETNDTTNGATNGVKMYGATMHAMEWLFEANRRKAVMPRDYKRVEEPRGAGVGLNPPAAQRQAPPPPSRPPPVAHPLSDVGELPVSSYGRATPPCYCDVQCTVKTKGGREFFVCKKARAESCKFFEWADEPARPENYTHFQRLGYAFEQLDKIQFEEAKERQKRQRETLVQQQQQQRSENQPAPPEEPTATKREKKKVKLESQVLSNTQRDLEYVDESTIFEELKCVICVSPFIEPRTAPCGHVFCQLCIFKYIEASSMRGAADGAKCPSCRNLIRVESLVDPEPSLLAFLGDLPVRCSCKPEGCLWTGKRAHLAGHEAECSYVVAMSVHGTSDPVQYAENGLVIVNDKERVEINAPSRLGPLMDALVDDNDDGDDDDDDDNGSNHHHHRRRRRRKKNRQSGPDDGDGDDWDSMDLCDSSDGDSKKSHKRAASPGDIRQMYSVFTPPGSDEDIDADQFEFNTAGNRTYIEPQAAATTLKPYITNRRASWAVGKAAAANELEKRQANNMNQGLVDELKKLADRYENLGDKWRARGHRLAAGTIMRTEFKITSADQVKGMPNIGDRILEKIRQYLAFGEFAKNRNPDADLLAKAELGKVHGVGAAFVEKLWVQGIRFLEQLRQRPDVLNRQQLIGLRYLDEFQLRIPREEVDEFKKIIDQVAFSIDPELILEICGSYRRGKSDCGDIDVLVTHQRFDKPLTGVLDRLVAGLTQRGVLTDALTTESVDDKWMGVGQLRPELPHRRVDFQLIARQSWACALLYFTGSALFNRSMRHYAGRQGLSLSQHALVIRNTDKHEKDMHKKGIPVRCMTEEDVFIALGLKYVEPHKRDM